MGPDKGETCLAKDLFGQPMRRRELLRGMAVGGVSLATFGIAGCGGSSGPSASSKAVGSKGLKKAVGFSQPDTSASIWQPLMVGARSAASKRGYQLLESHANSQLSAQVAEIETWIAEGVAGIIVLPLDNTAMQPLIAKAHQRGIKFLDYSDNALPNVDGWVIFDNLQGAKLVGTYAGHRVNKTLGGKAQVGLLTHQIQLTGRQRIEGAVKALQAVAPGAKVVAQHEGVLSPDTFPAFQAMLQAHPGINVAICIADEGCAGVEQAFMATHPSAQRVNDMFICGFDGSAPVIKAIETGGPIRATGALDAVGIGKAVIETAANAIEGKTPTKVNFPYVLCTAQTTALNQKLLAELG